MILDAYRNRSSGLLDLSDRANGMQRIAHETGYLDLTRAWLGFFYCMAENCLMTLIDGFYGARENSIRI